MPAKPKTKENAASPRRRNEKPVKKRVGISADNEAHRSTPEVEAYQIKLERQNLELSKARDLSEALLNQYTELYDFALVGYFTLAPDGMIRRANLTGSSMVGIDRSNLIGRSFAMLIASRQRAEFRIFIKKVFSRKNQECGEFELSHANPEKRIVRIEIRRSPNGLECNAMVLDVTSRTLAQEQMRVSENRYRRLFEAAHDGVLLVDPATNHIIDANPFMTRLLGYSRDQLIGKELFEIGLLKDEDASRKMFRKLKKNHEVRYENLPLESKTGRHKDVEVVANLYQEDGRSVIQCNIRDITLRKQAEEISSRNLKLKKEIVRREKIEEALRAQRKEQSILLKQSRSQQKQLRDLSHRILHIQEEERKKISRELHDVITQTLVGINVHLAVLDRGNLANPAAFKRQITKTQKLVKKAVLTVHNFARQLRPTTLDDLGLITALQAYMEKFMRDTGIRASLTASAKIDQTESTVRTALYRIAQGALTNVARHSKASRVDVTIESLQKVVRLTIKDDGKGFQVTKKAGSRKKSRLGLISMRERAEMLNGTFQIDSAAGEPTTVRVEIPVKKR
ncbi:MAG: PAS domain S-box protein [Verrucomicrobiota bacterium]